MPHHSQIRPDCLFRRILFNSPDHLSLRRRPQYPMMRKMHPAQEVYAGRQSFDENLIRMQTEFQLLFQKYYDCLLSGRSSR